MMKPQKTLLFFLAIILCLASISCIFPTDGILIFGSQRLKFPALKSFFDQKEIEKVDISHILKKSKVYSDSLETDKVLKLDSLSETDYSREPARTNDKYETPENIEKIQFPAGKEQLLMPFFAKLDNAKNEKVHILHFGDSQIETDHVTSYIRNQLQNKFSGYGLGLTPFVSPGGTSVLDKRASAGWKRFTLFGKVDTSIKHNNYGTLFSFSRFLRKAKDTLTNPSIEIVKSFFPSPRVRIFEEIKIFHSKCLAKVKVNAYLDKKAIANLELTNNNGLNISKMDFEKPLDHIRLEFVGNESPDFYGLSFESKTGVMVDNIAMRGSRALEFTLNAPGLLSEFAQQLNVKMLILQFGNNIVITANSAPNYERFYENQFYIQLSALKKIFPDIPIIVIGASDMAMKVDENFVSYPNIQQVIAAQKNAALRAGCAFWDLFKAMGGENSMTSWVTNDPPLAQKDYVHFSPQGAQIIGEMFYNALLFEYKKQETKGDKLLLE
jgi:lysophospholipase L1-like esterase